MSEGVSSQGPTLNVGDEDISNTILRKSRETEVSLSSITEKPKLLEDKSLISGVRIFATQKYVFLTLKCFI